MLKVHGLLFLLLPLATAGAQSQASVTEQRMISETDGGKPDTVLTRTISSGQRTRIDVTGPGSLLEPWRTMGTTQIIIASDSALTASYVDSAKKSYWSTNLRSMLASGLLGNEMKYLAAQRAPEAKRMAKVGSVVKTVTELKITVGGGAKTQRQTTELLSHQTMSVPDSLFVVPAGYTKTLPGFNPTR